MKRVYEEGVDPLQNGTDKIPRMVSTLYGFPFNIPHQNVPKKKSLYHCTRSPELTTMSTIHKEYLELSDIDLTKDVIVIKSHMGSGKTTTFLEIMKHFSRVLVVSCRRSYSDFLCTTTEGLIDYQTVKGPISVEEHPKIVVQVQSLKRIKGIREGITYAQWDLLYIDEPDGVFKELISKVSDTESRKEDTIYLTKLFSTIKKVIVTDAGLAPWHVKIMRTHLLSDLSFKEMSVVINTWKPHTHSVKIYSTNMISYTEYRRGFFSKIKKILGKDSPYVEISDFLLGKKESAGVTLYVKALLKYWKEFPREDSNGDIGRYLLHIIENTSKNIVVICNTKSQANLIYSLLSQNISEKELCIMTGDTPPDKRKWILQNTKECLTKCRVFIYNTVFKVGIDLNFDHFDEIFLMVDTLSCQYTPTLIDLFQCLGRSRRVRNLHIHIAQKKPKNKRDDSWWSEEESLYYPISTISKGEHLDYIVHKINNVERDLNDCSTSFTTALIHLLEHTIAKNISYEKTVVEESLLQTPSIVQMIKKKCLSSFKKKIARYTTLTPQTFLDLRVDSKTTTKKKELSHICGILTLLDGSIKNSLYLLYRTKKEEVKYWALHMNKHVYQEIQSPVDMDNFDEESLGAVNSDDLMEMVYKRLYSKNKHPCIRSLEEFEWVMTTLLSLLHKESCVYTTVDSTLKKLCQIFLNEYDIPDNPITILKGIVSILKLKIHINYVDESVNIIMPLRNDDINYSKMIAMILL